METPSFGTRLKYISLFIPFRLYLLLFLVGLFLAKLWLDANYTGVGSSFTAVLALLTEILIWFGSVILILSLLSVLIPWMIFLIRKSNGAVTVKIDTAVKEMEGNAKQLVKMKVTPLLHPPFGFLRYRLIYDGQKLSPKFSTTDQRLKLQFFSATQEGLYNWSLPEIKEYNIEKMVVYFEDIFQFFSFSTSIKVSDTFFTKPAKKDVSDLNLAPKKTEEENTRIEELRRVDGEYLNYKNFENNDDVRRILWKVYAKNKELVVRTQEILDPFASHIYLYASYLDGIKAGDQTILAQKGLNYYKTSIWSVYNQLKKQGFEVRYIADQELKQGNVTNADAKVQYNISLSNWHRTGSLKEYVNAKVASVVCISSLTPVGQVNELLDTISKDASVIFIRLSNGYKKQGITKWLRWIFLQEENEADNRNLMQWNMSNDKRKMMQNERAVADILKTADVKVITI
ncbi:MAG: DUF58 domain-containing protein [Chitinophagaceae bacterium]